MNRVMTSNPVTTTTAPELMVSKDVSRALAFGAGVWDLERSSGMLTMEERQLLRVRAHKFLAPLGTCWMVGMRHLRMEGRSGKMEELGGLEGLHCWVGEDRQRETH